MFVCPFVPPFRIKGVSRAAALFLFLSLVGSFEEGERGVSDKRERYMC